MKKILVTGGSGFIGSHTVVALLQKGYKVLIADNLSNSNEKVIDSIEQICKERPIFERVDLVDEQACKQLFIRHSDINTVIHFAAAKAVGESVKMPMHYYRNNLQSLLNVLDGMKMIGCGNLVFSSSCTVYGQPNTLPVTEEMPYQPATSPYGNTKQIAEEILKDLVASQEHAQAHTQEYEQGQRQEQVNNTFVDANISASTQASAPSALQTTPSALQAAPPTPPITWKILLLRYFNPIGAHESALIGELPNGVPNNLMPFITQTASGLRKELQVFGGDYNTPDGTPLRDYIHVCDLAEAHVCAMEYIHKNNFKGWDAINLGCGKGWGVLDVIKSFEKTSGIKLNYKIADRRAGDVEKIWGAVEKAKSKLGWEAKRSLDEMTLSAWKWQQYINSQE